MRVEQQPAYILHTRPYTDSRMLVDLFTRDYGKVTGVLRTPKKKKIIVKPQPFHLLSVSWLGKTELKTLTQLESVSQGGYQEGYKEGYKEPNRLFSGMYVNEFMYKLLPKEQPSNALFNYYGRLLKQLAISKSIEQELRLFEYFFLIDTGYGINFYTDASDKMIEPQLYYQYQYQVGFQCVAREINNKADLKKLIFSGKNINIMRGFLEKYNYDAYSVNDMDNEGIDSHSIKQSIKNDKTQDNIVFNKIKLHLKYLIRYVFHHQLQGRPLQARQLFS